MTVDPSKDPPLVQANLAISIELPEVFRSWFWVFYDHFGFLLLFNLSWSLCVFGMAWGWSHFWKFPPVGILGPVLIFLFLLSESLVSIGWAFGVFKIFMDRRASWSDIREGFSRFWWKGSLVAGVFWFVLILGALDLNYLWAHPILDRAVTYTLLIFTFWILFFWILIGFYLWPVLFFQEPSLPRIFYRASLLAWESGGRNILYLVVVGVNSAVFTLLWPLWFFVGPASIFSLQSVALEKALLKYRITFKDKELSEFLGTLERERERTWREFLRPWENR